MRKQKGFSLIELLIVVAIILIIAAIAIPNLLRARIAANESAAVGNLRTINTAEISYYTMFGDYAVTALTQLQTPGGVCPEGGPTVDAACLIDETLAAAIDADTQKTGYYFALGDSDTTGYTLDAHPADPGSSGVKHFYTDASAVIHANPDADAGPGDPAIK